MHNYHGNCHQNLLSGRLSLKSLTSAEPTLLSSAKSILEIITMNIIMLWLPAPTLGWGLKAQTPERQPRKSGVEFFWGGSSIFSLLIDWDPDLFRFIFLSPYYWQPSVPLGTFLRHRIWDLPCNSEKWEGIIHNALRLSFNWFVTYKFSESTKNIQVGTFTISCRPATSFCPLIYFIDMNKRIIVLWITISIM